MSPEEMSAVQDRIERAKECRDELVSMIRRGDVDEATLEELELALFRSSPPYRGCPCGRRDDHEHRLKGEVE